MTTSNNVYNKKRQQTMVKLKNMEVALIIVFT